MKLPQAISVRFAANLGMTLDNTAIFTLHTQFHTQRICSENDMGT